MLSLSLTLSLSLSFSLSHFLPFSVSHFLSSFFTPLPISLSLLASFTIFLSSFSVGLYYLSLSLSLFISIFLFYDASLSFAPVPFRDRTENCILTIIIFARVCQKLGSKMLLSVQCSLTLETRTFDVPERSREKKIFS